LGLAAGATTVDAACAKAGAAIKLEYPITQTQKISERKFKWNLAWLACACVGTEQPSDFILYLPAELPQ
jgi:hypothetical protein